MAAVCFLLLQCKYVITLIGLREEFCHSWEFKVTHFLHWFAVYPTSMLQGANRTQQVPDMVNVWVAIKSSEQCNWGFILGH